MIFEDVTIQDCQREALLETQVVMAQRKIVRLFKQIETKEEIAQRVTSQWFCEHYDSEIGIRYHEIAQLDGAVRAAKLELERLADKRYADKARRLAALALIEEAQLGKKTAAGTTSASPSSNSRQKQQAMFFGPGAPPAAPPESAAPSVTVDQKAEDDIARAFEICSREIPPPDPTPTASTPAAAASSGMPAAAPLTHSTLSRLAMPAVDTESGSVGGEADESADDAAANALQAEDSPDEDAASVDEPAACSEAPACPDAHASTGTHASDVAQDSRNEPQGQAAEAPCEDAGDVSKQNDGDVTGAMK